MKPVNHVKKALIKAVLVTIFLTSSFWLAFFTRRFINTSGMAMVFSFGIAFLITPVVLFASLSKSITKKIIFEGRLKQRIKKTRETFLLREKKNSQIKDHLIEAIIVIDEHSRICSANRVAKRLLPAVKTLKYVSLAEVIREPEIHELIAQAREQQEMVEKAIAIGAFNPTQFIIRAFPMNESEVLLSLLDISRFHTDEKYNDFIAHASHELKTPISVIMANAELLVDGDFDERTDILVRAIVRQSLCAKKLLDSLLELLRFDAGKYVLAPKLVNLDPFFRDLKLSLGHVGVGIRTQIPSDVFVFADPELLERLAVIIIDNAEKYAGPNVTLTIKSIKEKDKIKIRFIDNGPGIKSHLREKVFERFYREHEHSDKEGFGLGLSHARAIANFMQGRIFVDNLEAPGCCMTLELNINSPGPCTKRPQPTGSLPFSTSL
jgi:signal transduction histidine kinase